MKKFLSVTRARYGLDSWRELALRIPLRVARALGLKNESFYANLYGNAHIRRLAKKFTTQDCIQIKDVKLPLLTEKFEHVFFGVVFEDTFASYCYFDDRYDEEIFTLCDSFLSEGLYGRVNDTVNVTVEPNDIVIDAGSWIGDFAAYSSTKVKWGGGGVKFLRLNRRTKLSSISSKPQH